MASLSLEDLEDLQSFLKDWLRHSGRTQADLRRALRVSSIRMPVLLDELHRIHGREGSNGLAERLCGIDLLWQEQPGSGEDDLLPDLDSSLGQLDLLLEEIRQEAVSGGQAGG